MTRIRFGEIRESDLLAGSVYEGGAEGTISGEPIDLLLHCGNMGGFRVKGSVRDRDVRLAVLFTTLSETDWPDRLDPITGQFIYYGDNRRAGQELHRTPKQGNELLRQVFEAIHVQPPRRDLVPPFFVFSKAEPGRAVRFHGLAVPGANDVREDRDLVAAWRTKGGDRFQNYVAIFTLLDAPIITRRWIDDLLRGDRSHRHAPEAWTRWIETGERVEMRSDEGH